MIFDLMDRLGSTLDRGTLRGRLRKTFLYVIWKWVRAIPMIFDYRMINLYSRKSFRDQLDDTECSNWVSLWLQSYQKPPETLIWVLDLKDPVPWINFKAIFYIEFFLMGRGSTTVFEYGSGASTLWFSKRAARVVSVESDKRWHDYLNALLKEIGITNVTYYLAEPQLADKNEGDFSRFGSFFKAYRGMHFKDYVQTILRDTVLYDVIFVDGEARSACLELAKRKVKDDGIIVLDNSSRTRYQNAIASFSEWEILRFTGPVSYGELVEETTIFRKMSTG